MRILFVGIDYHHYTRALIDEMRAQGADVTYVDIQPRSLFFKIFRTLAKKAYDAFVQAHHARELRKAASSRLDRVVFLQAHQIDPALLKEIRALQPGVPFVLYNWDSLTTHDYLAQAPYFDKIFTFDSTDAAAHGFHYLPLFGVKAMQHLRKDVAKSRAVYTVGNIVNPNRYSAARAFEAYCAENNIEFDAFLKITPVVYLRMILGGVVPRRVSFRSIGTERFHQMVERSQAVFDFANHRQSGQTMRMIENVVCGKKIITNNACVRDESFFSSDRILVYEGLDFSEVSAFLDVPIADPSADFSEYGIAEFTRRLLLLDDQGAEA